MANKEIDIKNKILEVMHSVKVVTTSEVAEELEVSWNTAEKHLLELTLEDKIMRMKKAGVNLWVVNFFSKKFPENQRFLGSRKPKVSKDNQETKIKNLRERNENKT